VDSGVDFDRLVDLHKKDSLFVGVVIGMNEPWTELTVPQRGERQHPVHHAVCRNRGRCQHYPGSSATLAPSVPLLFVMKKTERGGG
jgi:hypothetical protein